MYALRGWVGSSPVYVYIAYYMQKGGGWVQIACIIAYVLNGRPLRKCLADLKSTNCIQKYQK